LLIFVENIKLSLLETLLSPFKSAISLHGWLQASMGTTGTSAVLSYFVIWTNN
jgi:hypothetical protein